MRSKRLNLTIPDWIYSKYVKEAGNDPERIRELITKGIMYEKENDNGMYGIQSWDVNGFGQFPVSVA